MTDDCAHEFETVSDGATGWSGSHQMDVYYEFERCKKCGKVKEGGGE